MAVEARELASILDERPPGQLPFDRSLQHRVRIDLLEHFVERPFGSPWSDAGRCQLLAHPETTSPAVRFAAGDGARSPRIVDVAGLSELRESGIDFTGLVGSTRQAY